MLVREPMSIARNHSEQGNQTTTAGTLPKSLKVGGGGNFLKFSAEEGPHFLRTFTRGAALSPARFAPSGPNQ